MEQNNKYLVCVNCFTYNHAQYIFDAMNGFTMQRTDFPFVCCIVDDASTDGEPEVIRQYLADHFKEPFRTEETEYADVICAHHKDNPNCDFVVLLLKYNHYSIKKSKMDYLAEWSDKSDYNAICEGDDYWLSNDKLQKQVDYLERHQNVKMVGHAFYIVSPKKGIIGEGHPLKTDGIIGLEQILLNTSTPQTATLLYRSGLYNKRPSFFYKLDVGDYPLRVFFAINGGIYYINDVMSAYRKHSGGWTANNDSYHDKIISHINKMKEFAKALDDFTEHKYHEMILKRMDYLEFLTYCQNGSIFKSLNSLHFRRMRFQDKIKFVLKGILPQMRSLYNRNSKSPVKH